jgi:hypothetical protein
MKKAFYTLTAFALVLISLSCQKTKNNINDATEFDISYTTQFTMPATDFDGVDTASFITPDISTDSDKKFASENTAADLVESIALTKLNVISVNGNMDFLKDMDISLMADKVNPSKVASKSNIPTGTTTLAADVSGLNIKDYIKKDKVKLKVFARVDGEVKQDQNMKIEITVRVAAKKIK